MNEEKTGQQTVKNDILDKIKQGKPAALPLPVVPMFPYKGDPVEDFINQLINFDGQVIQFKSRESAVEWLNKQLQEKLAQKKIYSSASGIEGNISEEMLADLHNATQINICVSEADMGVGEMGAVWVTDASLKHAACAHLSRHLYILLDSTRIFGGLHEAYAHIQLPEHQYGSFFTGPSATADIEAVHITGAQGPLVFTVLLYNRENALPDPVLQTNPDADKSVWAQEILAGD